MHLFLLGWTTVIRYYPAVLKNSLKSLQLIKTAAARVLTGRERYFHPHCLVFPDSLLHPECILKSFSSYIRNNQAPSYLKDLIVSHHPNRALCSQTTGFFVIPRAFKSKIGGIAFSFQFTLWIQESKSLSTFKKVLKL